MKPKHLVKRAVIVAAGTGNRMRPLTLSVPKPLVEVNGRKMISTVIDALKQNGITEIHVVTGYLKEQFACLKEDHPEIDLIENPMYDTCNNISSLYFARQYLEDCIILDGDQIIHDPKVLHPEFDRSGYNAVWTEEETNEWLMDVKDGIVQSCSRTGGKKGWQLYSISRWTAEDGRRLKNHLEYEFDEKKNRTIYWDDVPMFCHFTEYELGITPMNRGDVEEIDSLQELAEADTAYSILLKEIYDDQTEK